MKRKKQGYWQDVKIGLKEAQTVKFPKEVWEAMQKRIKAKQKYYPRYSEADLIRTSVVKHLKEKGLLDKKEAYL